MIKVKIEIETDEKTLPIAQINITNLTGPVKGETDLADYVAEFVMRNHDSIRMISRTIHNFPRNEINALGLILVALTKLEEEYLTRNGDIKSDPFSTEIFKSIAKMRDV